MRKIPVMIGHKLNKGIMTIRSKHGGFDALIVWLNRECESGETFELSDIRRIDEVLHFCDRESVEQTIRALKWIMEQWKEVDEAESEDNA